MKRVAMVFYMMSLLGSYMHADTITLYNQTSRDLYVALYQQSTLPFWDHSGKRATDVYFVEARQEVSIVRPADRWGYAIWLVFAESASACASTLSSGELDAMHPLKADAGEGTLFYCALEDDGIYGYTASEWAANGSILQEAEKELFSDLPPIEHNPHKNSFAFVRAGNGLCPAECECMIKRTAQVSKALSQAGFAPSQKKVPRIALACSGGGYRAMLYTTGALKALSQKGSFDYITYLVGLSGSTWAIASWISSGKSIAFFHDWLMKAIGDPAHGIGADISLIEDALLTKYSMGEPVGFVDLYGAFLGHTLLSLSSSNADLIYLSDQGMHMHDGAYPLPIYTAVSGQEGQSAPLWYEVTPFETGNMSFAAYVPTWSFGRKFKNGLSITNAPEQPLGAFLATFGFAVGATIQEIFANENIAATTKYALVNTLINTILHNYGTERIVTAEYLNYVYQLASVASVDGIDIARLPVLSLVDAGTDFNLPYPPISGQRAERAADIIIFLDASAGVIGDELKKVEAYARAQGLPFPAIDYTEIAQHAVSLFTDENPAAPVVLYVPIIVDRVLLEKNKAVYPALYQLLKNFNSEDCIASGACNTFNFSYTPEQAETVAALGEFNAAMAHDVLMKVLQRYYR